MKNVHDLLDDGKTAFSRRFEEDFKGPIIPFGAEVSYVPISEADKKRCHNFGSNTKDRSN